MEAWTAMGTNVPVSSMTKQRFVSKQRVNISRRAERALTYTIRFSRDQIEFHYGSYDTLNNFDNMNRRRPLVASRISPWTPPTFVGRNQPGLGISFVPMRHTPKTCWGVLLGREWQSRRLFTKHNNAFECHDLHEIEYRYTCDSGMTVTELR